MTTNTTTCAECGIGIVVELDHNGVPLGDGLCAVCAVDLARDEWASREAEVHHRAE